MGFSSAMEAKMNHWFSRRHQSAEAHLAVREANANRFAEKYGSAQQRSDEAKRRKPEDQLASLDRAFGKGMGAQRERARLARKIEAAKQKPVEKPKAQKGDSPKKAQKGDRRERSVR